MTDDSTIAMAVQILLTAIPHTEPGHISRETEDGLYDLYKALKAYIPADVKRNKAHAAWREANPEKAKQAALASQRKIRERKRRERMEATVAEYNRILAAEASE